jgi:hypothetical protein
VVQKKKKKEMERYLQFCFSDIEKIGGREKMTLKVGKMLILEQAI